MKIACTGLLNHISDGNERHNDNNDMSSLVISGVSDCLHHSDAILGGAFWMVKKILRFVACVFNVVLLCPNRHWSVCTNSAEIF